jgi:hypothetical protein
MKILIVGSMRHLPPNPEALKDACRDIGAAIAKQGYPILTGSDNPDTVTGTWSKVPTAFRASTE